MSEHSQELRSTLVKLWRSWACATGCSCPSGGSVLAGATSMQQGLFVILMACRWVFVNSPASHPRVEAYKECYIHASYLEIYNEELQDKATHRKGWN
eukprot:1353956-Amphidinium_carterae.1